MMFAQKKNNNDLDYLLDLINMKTLAPANSVVLNITPNMANYILENLNVNNRRFKREKIKQYASDMLMNNWLLTGQPIIFGNDGLLKDGQNRLSACVKAECAFESQVVFGVHPDSFSVMDTGARRDLKDIMTILNVKNAVQVASCLRQYLSFESGASDSKTDSLYLTNDFMREYYEEKIDSDLMQKAVLKAKQVYEVTGLSKSILGALYYWASVNGNNAQIVAFFESLINSHGGQRSPQKILMRAMAEIRNNPALKISIREQSIMIGRSWCNFRDKKLSKKSDMNVYANDVLPKI